MPQLGESAKDPRKESRQPADTVADPRTGMGQSPSGGFMDALVSAATREMVGMEPSEEARQFAEENPALGMVAKVGGMAPYYITPLTRVGMQGIRAIPFAGRGIRTGERLIEQGRPVLGSAWRDVSAIGTMEAGRLGVAGAMHGIGSEEQRTVLGQAAVELAVTGGIGAAIGHFRRALPPAERSVGIERQIQEFDQRWAFDSPPQAKIQHVKDILERRRAEISEGFAADLGRYKNILKRQARRQSVRAVRAPIGKIEEGTAGGRGRQLQRQLTKRWMPDDRKHWRTRRMDIGPRQGGMHVKEFERLKTRLNLPEDWEAHSFFPVITAVKTREGARHMQTMIDKFGSSVKADGHQTWIQRENSEGGFIMIRRTEPDKMGRIEKGDEFFMVKTDQPEFWAPDLAGFGSAGMREMAHLNMFEKTRPSSSAIVRAVDDAENQLGSVGNLSGEIATKSRGDVARSIAERLIGKDRVEELAVGSKKSFDFVGRHAREYVIPTISRYLGPQGNALAGHIVMTAKAAHDRGRAMATRILFGDQPISAKTPIWQDLWSGARHREEGLLRKVDQLSDSELGEVSRAIAEAMSPQEIVDAGFSAGAQRFLTELRRVDRHVVGEFNRAMREIGRPELDPLLNHYMISRMWRGTRRLEIKDGNGNLVAVAGGRNRQEVIAEADRLVHVINESGTVPGRATYNPRMIRHADEATDLSIAANLGDRQMQLQRDWLIRTRTPTLRREFERKGIKGFEFEDKPFTHKELRQKLTRQVREMHQAMAARTVDEKLAHRLHSLRAQDPEMYRRAVDDLNSMAGQRGKFAATVETEVDRLLEPLFGFRAAEMARFANQALFHLTLGMGNLGFAALNAVQVMQTALPEAAYVMRAAPSALRGRYGYNIVNTPDGGTQVVRALDPLRLIGRGWNHMNNPNDELWRIYQRARDEGRIAPVLSEEVFGPNADLVSHFRGFFQERRTFFEMLQETSAYLPARTEELSRGMALSMGYELGKNFLRLEGEALYQFAARFVDNTHFRYSASDRAVMLRGAFGSMYGLFKSWMTHYIANMAVYAGDAWRNGNFGPLIWSQVGTMSVAGLSGTAMLPLAKGLNSLMSDRELIENLYTDFGYSETDEAGRLLLNPRDAIWDGLPAFIGLSLGQRANVPGADVPNDIQQLWSIMHYDRAVALGDFVGAGIDTFRTTGQHPAQNQEVINAMARAFLPRVGQAFIRRTEEGAMQSLRTQNRLLSDVTMAESVIDAFGFTPNRLNRAYAAMDIMFDRAAEQQDGVRRYSEMLAQAMQDRNNREVRRLLRRAREDGIPLDSILAGADSRIAKRDEELLQRQFDEELRDGLTRRLGIERRRQFFGEM